MSAIVTTLPQEPTGPYADLLPVALPSAGVAGYTNRWTHHGIDSLAVAATVSSWVPTAGAKTLTHDFGTAPVVAEPVAGEKVVKFTAGSLRSTSSIGKSFAAVLRLTDAGSVENRFMSLGTARLIRLANNNLQAVNFTSGTQVATVAMASNAWHVVVWTHDATTMTARVNGNFSTVTGTLDAKTEFTLGRGSSTVGQVEYAEVIEWDTALTQAQGQSVYQALKAAHPLLNIA